MTDTATKTRSRRGGGKTKAGGATATPPKNAQKPKPAAAAKPAAEKPKPEPAKPEAAKPAEAKVAVPKRKPVIGRPTKKPADLKKAAQQPTGGEIPNKTLIAKAREDWGIEPYFEGEIIAIKPAQRGRLVHAKKDAHSTLCNTDTDKWVGHQKATDEDVNCLWCLARVKGR